MVNKQCDIVVFQFPELRLHSIDPKELPVTWNSNAHDLETQNLVIKYLSNNKEYDGVLIPSTTINGDIATHPVNTIRHCVYANVAVNILSIGLSNIKVLHAYSPVYSNRIFNL